MDINSSDNKILIIDDSKVILKMMERYLSNQGYAVVTADSAVKAAKILQKEEFLLIITDISMPNVSGLDLLLWIKNNKPESRVVVMTAFSSDEMKKFVSKTGAINYIEKNGDLNHLNNVIIDSFSKGFTGNIKDISLFDFLNIIYLSKSSKAINVEDPNTNNTGVIVFKDGEIIHAKLNNLEGEDAFYKIMEIDSGDFYDSEVPLKNSVVTIKTPFNFLLMNAAKIIDEARRNKSILQLTGNKKINQKKSILVIDDNLITLSIIKEILEKHDYQVTTVDNMNKAIDLINLNNFNLVISDIMVSSGQEGLELLLWIRKNKPKLKVIMMTSIGGDETQTFPIQKGDLIFFDKNINFNHLVDLVSSTIKEKTFSGKVTDINILNFIQVVCVSGQSKLVCLEDSILKKQNRIYIKNGKVVHAESEGFEGEDAFYDILEIKNGKLYDLPWEKPSKETISKSLSSLLLSAFKVMYKDVFLDENYSNIDLKVNARAIERSILQNESLKKFKSEKDPKKKLTIYESGVVLGICTGITKREEVESIMYNFSKIRTSNMRKSKVINYSDLGLKVYFDDYGVAQSISFSYRYKGLTDKNIGIGSNIHKILEIYDEYETDHSRFGVILKNIAFLCKDENKVSCIKIGDFQKILKSNITKEQMLKQIFDSDYNFDADLKFEELSGIIMGSGKNKSLRNLFSKTSTFSSNDSSQGVVVYDNFQINIWTDEKGKVKAVSLGDEDFDTEKASERDSFVKLSMKVRLNI